MALTDKLGAIADAIRSKTGKTAAMTLDEMPTEIASIVSTNNGGFSNIEIVTLSAQLHEGNATRVNIPTENFENLFAGCLLRIPDSHLDNTVAPTGIISSYFYKDIQIDGMSHIGSGVTDYCVAEDNQYTVTGYSRLTMGAGTPYRDITSAYWSVGYAGYGAVLNSARQYILVLFYEK